jgi:hypothetical protein
MSVSIEDIIIPPTTSNIMENRLEYFYNAFSKLPGFVLIDKYFIENSKFELKFKISSIPFCYFSLFCSSPSASVSLRLMNNANVLVLTLTTFERIYYPSSLTIVIWDAGFSLCTGSTSSDISSIFLVSEGEDGKHYLVEPSSSFVHPGSGNELIVTSGISNSMNNLFTRPNDVLDAGKVFIKGANNILLPTALKNHILYAYTPVIIPSGSVIIINGEEYFAFRCLNNVSNCYAFLLKM